MSLLISCYSAAVQSEIFHALWKSVEATPKDEQLMVNYSSPEDLERVLGEQLRHERLRQNITMNDLAVKSSVTVQTIRALETGKGARVSSLIRVVCALGRTEWISNFQPPVRISPLQIAKGTVSRQRGSRSVYPSLAKPYQKKNTGGED